MGLLKNVRIATDEELYKQSKSNEPSSAAKDPSKKSKKTINEEAIVR